MTPYVPHTEQDRREMLAEIGARSIDDLFREIPPKLRVSPGTLRLPPALGESGLMSHLKDLADKNLDASKLTCFLGAGIYDRFVPSTVDAVISRGEFLTAYTPYQPEESQGSLQTIYEFQSMVAELYGMDLANASMYDGSTAMAEAAIMAAGIKDHGAVYVSSAVHPRYRQVLETYCWSIGLKVEIIAHQGGAADAGGRLEDGASCLIVQSPNFFGTIENLRGAREEADRVGALLIVVADPISCALLKPPGQYGADVVVGEGQPMGVSMGLGGPLVGLFACKEQFVRQIPGRIVGRTKEVHGERDGYVMTLRTREQDIRREKATSNICTNEALMALAATVYMTTLGKNGMRSIAETSARNTIYAKKRLCEAGGKVRFAQPVFDEFVLDLPKPAVEVRDALLERGILGGLPLGDYCASMDRSLLVAVTELRTKVQIDRYAAALVEVLA